MRRAHLRDELVTASDENGKLRDQNARLLTETESLRVEKEELCTVMANINSQNDLLSKANQRLVDENTALRENIRALGKRCFDQQMSASALCAHFQEDEAATDLFVAGLEDILAGVHTEEELAEYPGGSDEEESQGESDEGGSDDAW